jgi:virginiamycin B lyase
MIKGIIIFGIIAILIISTIVVLVSNVSETENEEVDVLTGTPADNYLEISREKFCGTEEAKSTKYIKEYKIPTDCTQPLAIIADPQGNIWFAQSNTGNLAKFNPLTESFTEYNNEFWPKGDRSMIWGLDYASNGTLWFTDDEHDSIWKFEIQTQEYDSFSRPIFNDSLLQKLEVVETRIFVNDFTGNHIVILDNIQSDEVITYSIPSTAPEAVISDFTIDSKNNLWYSNWALEVGGLLTKVNKTAFDLSSQNNDVSVSSYSIILPPSLKTPNGIAEDDFGNIWIADSSSSLIFKFDPVTENFSKYTTSKSSILTYGNYTGQIKSTASQPYWIEKDSSGKLVFNEQGANRIGILDPDSESLVEYSIPSQNPHWGDCGNQKDCGLSQVFDFTIHGEKIWFSEWAENNIGYVDTTIPIPIDIRLQSDEVSLEPGQSKNFNFVVSSDSQSTIESTLIILNPNPERNVMVTPNSNQETFSLNSDAPLTFDIEISSSETAFPYEYKILLGAKTDYVSFGKFLTVIIE